MKWPGKKLIRSQVEQQVARRTEIKDAIVWDLPPDGIGGHRRCRVKIQGSSELITAFFPQNWNRIPEWVRPGNAVQVFHPGGNRGRVEVYGHGRTVPMPVEGPTLPDTAPGGNTILTGIQLKPAGGLAVYVTGGTFRYNGTVYQLSDIVMATDSELTMGSELRMGMGDAGMYIELQPPPEAPNFRYDIVSLDGTGTLHYVPGSESTNPQIPKTPTGHILVGYVLLYPGMVEVTQDDINRYWSDPVLSEVVLEFDPNNRLPFEPSNRLDWPDPVGEDPIEPYEGYVDLTVRVILLDQYGLPVYHSSGWEINLNIISGSGSLIPEGYQRTWRSRNWADWVFRWSENGGNSVMLEAYAYDDERIEILDVLYLYQDVESKIGEEWNKELLPFAAPTL